jgi:hypothetical protein
MPTSSATDKGPSGQGAGSRTGPTQARREELQKEVLDLLSSQQPSDPALTQPLRTPSSRLLQPSTPAAAAPARSPVNGKTPHPLLLQQRSCSLDGTHSDKEDRDQGAIVVPVLDEPESAQPQGPASSGSITRAWLDDMAHGPHGHPPGWRGLSSHCKQAARVSVRAQSQQVLLWEGGRVCACSLHASGSSAAAAAAGCVPASADAHAAVSDLPACLLPLGWLGPFLPTQL